MKRSQNQISILMIFQTFPNYFLLRSEIYYYLFSQLFAKIFSFLKAKKPEIKSIGICKYEDTRHLGVGPKLNLKRTSLEVFSFEFREVFQSIFSIEHL